MVTFAMAPDKGVAFAMLFIFLVIVSPAFPTFPSSSAAIPSSAWSEHHREGGVIRRGPPAHEDKTISKGRGADPCKECIGVASLSPSSGPCLGGVRLNLTLAVGEGGIAKVGGEDQIAISIGGRPCTGASWAANGSMLSCTLPPGVGYGLPVGLRVGAGCVCDWSSTGTASFSYHPPSVSSISVPEGGVPTGGGTVTLLGVNLGGHVASPSVTFTPDASVSFLPVMPGVVSTSTDGTIVAGVPAGVGAGWDIRVSVGGQNGGVVACPADSPSGEDANSSRRQFLSVTDGIEETMMSGRRTSSGSVGGNYNNSDIINVTNGNATAEMGANGTSGSGGNSTGFGGSGTGDDNSTGGDSISGGTPLPVCEVPRMSYVGPSISSVAPRLVPFDEPRMITISESSEPTTRRPNPPASESPCVLGTGHEGGWRPTPRSQKTSAHTRTTPILCGALILPGASAGGASFGAAPPPNSDDAQASLSAFVGQSACTSPGWVSDGELTCLASSPPESAQTPLHLVHVLVANQRSQALPDARVYGVGGGRRFEALVDDDHGLVSEEGAFEDGLSNTVEIACDAVILGGLSWPEGALGDGICSEDMGGAKVESDQVMSLRTKCLCRL